MIRDEKSLKKYTNSMQSMVEEFHKKFSAVVNKRPTALDEKTIKLRESLMQEELKELLVAMYADDLNGVADGIADLLYVVMGTAVSFGINIQPVFEEVHRSNMSKVWEDGTVHYNELGKVIKPPTYSPANIVKILSNQLGD